MAALKNRKLKSTHNISTFSAQNVYPSTQPVSPKSRNQTAKKEKTLAPKTDYNIGSYLRKPIPTLGKYSTSTKTSARKAS
jgi:hypothetical protein